MINKKYIFFDIDGTILTSEGIVLDSTKEALNQAQANGHEIFINTGRSRNIIPEILDGLNFDGVVCGTGSQCIYRGKEVFHKSFTQEQIDRVIDITTKNNIPIIMSSRTECVGSSVDLPQYIELFTGGAVKASEVQGLKDIGDDNILATMRPVVVDDNKAEYSKNYTDVSDFIFIKAPFTVDEFNSLIGPDINISKASFKNPDEFSGEITISACSKATGIDEMLKFLGVNLEDAIAIGDGFNDVDMLKHAHLSIAMGNSPDEIKNISDYVTDDIYNNGIYNALKHFKII